MTRTQSFVLGSALWLGGIGVFAGLAYALDRPLEIPAPEPVSAPVQLTAANIVAEPVYEHVITIPPIEIVGHAPKPFRFAPQVIAPVASPVPASLHPTDISAMRCGDWRPLEQGGSESSVRECE